MEKSLPVLRMSKELSWLTEKEGREFPLGRVVTLITASLCY
jgi:hypothetical protein